MASGDVVRYRVKVSGRVQGVWYRETCRRQAEAAGITGWVRNNYDDGSVEAALEGDELAVEEVLRWMRAGPRRAVVTDMRVDVEPPKGEQIFVVR